MTSLSGNKDRSVSSRSRKHGVPELSPTKSAFIFPDTWYRKAYEETSKSNMRPNPEGAGSMPSSTGTPSPGSGISSPGSFSGSPGTVSPGIETGSPGSLGGSPGFGTGSPASGSGSSPCSERGALCESCNVQLTEMKRQALKLLIPGPYSSKDHYVSLPLKPPNSSDSGCDVCGAHLTQLKQEACMALPLEQWDLSPTSSPTALFQRYVSSAPPGVQEVNGGLELQDCLPPLLPSSSSTTAFPPPSTVHMAQKASPGPNKSPNASPSHRPYHLAHRSPSGGQTFSGAPTTKQPQKSGHRLGSKPNFLGLGGGDRRSGSPVSGANSSSNSCSTVGGSTDTDGGVSLAPNQVSQLSLEVSRERPTDMASTRSSTDSAAHSSSPSLGCPAVTTVTQTTTSAAASFFARAAQKLSLASKKRKQKAPLVTAAVTSGPSSCGSPLFDTNFSSSLVLTPPPAPPCLLRAANKIKDTPGLGKVKVMVRVCPVSQQVAAESSSFLKVDPRKKQIMIMDPSANQTPASQKKAGANQASPKMFTFDAAFPPDASQVEVCAGTVAEVIQSVVNGADGCVFCFGHSKLGKSYTMIGRDDSLQTLGVIPCAISWLFKVIDERREKSGARFSVRVSAVEVWGRDENLKDLLSEVDTGNIQESQSQGVYLCEDPICGMQLQNQSELRASTAEKAAWYLDAAIAARHNSRNRNTTEEEHRNSHMLFTLHLYQNRMEKTSKGGMSGGRSRLHLLDLGSCDTKVLVGGGRSREHSSPSAPLCLSLSALGNVILALVNGSKHIPYKESKLTMLLRESLGNINCRTTMIAHISASPQDFSETLYTIQIASRVLRLKKKKSKVTVQYTSSSSGGESSCEEGHMRRPTQLRPFHPCGSELLLLLPTDPDDHSSSEHSCDTVIYVGSNGGALSDRELTDNEGPPEFVPITPTLLQRKVSKPQQEQQEKQQEEQQEQEQQQHRARLEAPLDPVPEKGAECLKCNTFAELQERLDCIDGSEEVITFPFEEVPAHRQTRKQEACLSYSTVSSGVPAAAALMDVDTKTAVSKGKSSDPQLQEIKVVLEEAVLAQTMIDSLAHMSGSSKVTCSSVTVHSSCEASGCTADTKARLMVSPRLGIASLSKTPDYRPPSSPSQRCKVFTQKSVQQTTAATSISSVTLQPWPEDAVTTDSSVCSSAESLVSRISTLSSHTPGHDPTPYGPVSVHDGEAEMEEDRPRRTSGDTEKSTPVQTQALLSSTSNLGELSFENPWLRLGPSESSGEEKDSDQHSHRDASGSTDSSPDVLKRVVDGCEMVAAISQGEALNMVNLDIHRTASLPRGWHCLNLHDSLDKRSDHCIISSTASTPSSPRATLDRRGSAVRQGFFSYKRNGLPPAPPVRKSSLDQQSKAASPPNHGDEAMTSGCIQPNVGRQGIKADSGRLFSARLEQLANRAHSLGRPQKSRNSSYHYDYLSLERAESLRGGRGPGAGVKVDSTMHRTSHNLHRTSSLSSSPVNSHQQVFRAGSGPSSAPQSPAHGSSQSRLSAVSKLLLSNSPRGRSLSTSSTKSPSLSNKLPTSPTNGRSCSAKLQSSAHSLQQGPAGVSWSTQSLNRLRGGGLAAKLPLRAVNGRISELLQGSVASRSRSPIQGGGAEVGDEKILATSSGDAAATGSISSEDRAAADVQTLPPSPYSKITAPRKPHRCSSGHASDNSSVLSGELPPAMGRTALFYHSGGSSGYESMMRDSSENTGSTSSPQDSLSEESMASTSSRRSSKNSKKIRSCTGLQRRRLIPALTFDTSSSSSSSSSPSHRSAKQPITSSSSSSSSSQGACWVDGPLGLQPPSTTRGLSADATETFEIKVYKIDDVERLTRRRDRRVSKDVAHQPSARLHVLEHRQQRISDLRAKYQGLKKELELTKQYLMVEEQTWTSELQLQQVQDLDSLEDLEALETLTFLLETRVNFCKAHLMMVTCFDCVSSKH